MFMYPYTLIEGGEETVYQHISDAAQAWADSEDAVLLDACGVEIPSDVLWDLV